MTTPLIDKLLKIRQQIYIAQKYVAENPDWESSKIILELLRKRETQLLDEIENEKRGEK